jgi:hypothetical protein
MYTSSMTKTVNDGFTFSSFTTIFLLNLFRSFPLLIGVSNEEVDDVVGVVEDDSVVDDDDDEFVCFVGVDNFFIDDVSKKKEE